MTPKDLEAALVQTLEDRRISGAEKRVLTELLREEQLSESQRALLRHRVFELAQAELADPKAKDVLDWLEAVNKLLMPPVDTAKSAKVEAFFSPGNDCASRIIDLLSAAQFSADLCIFTIADDRISSAVLSAHQRRVKVRILSDNDKAYDAGSDIGRFRQAGIPVRVDRGPDHMHHKFAVFDNRTLLTGSFNWTRSASVGNHENIIVSDDARMVGPFAKEFQRLWQEMGD